MMVASNIARKHLFPQRRLGASKTHQPVDVAHRNLTSFTLLSRAFTHAFSESAQLRLSYFALWPNRGHTF